jgi:hypothetical protein
VLLILNIEFLFDLDQPQTAAILFLMVEISTELPHFFVKCVYYLCTINDPPKENGIGHSTLYIRIAVVYLTLFLYTSIDVHV